MFDGIGSFKDGSGFRPVAKQSLAGIQGGKHLCASGRKHLAARSIRGRNGEGKVCRARNSTAVVILIGSFDCAICLNVQNPTGSLVEEIERKVCTIRHVESLYEMEQSNNGPIALRVAPVSNRSLTRIDSCNELFFCAADCNGLCVTNVKGECASAGSVVRTHPDIFYPGDRLSIGCDCGVVDHCHALVSFTVLAEVNLAYGSDRVSARNDRLV